MCHKLASEAEVWYNERVNIVCLKGATWQFSTPRRHDKKVSSYRMVTIPQDNTPRKNCKGPCGEIKSLDEFFRNKRRPDGREARCKVCQKPAAHAAQARYYARVPHHMRPSKSKGMKAASIGFQEREQALTQQNGLCAICGKPETSRYRTEVKKLSVDHDHLTGRFRGLLCQKCNTRLAALEDADFVELAIDYLIRTQSGSIEQVLDVIMKRWETFTHQTAQLLDRVEVSAHE